MKILSAVLSLFFVSSFSLEAAEADHYTVEDAQVVDVTSQVNAMANEGLQQKLDELNGQGACDYSQESEERLYAALTDIFSNHKKGQLVNAILDGRIERTVIPLNQSVYNEWSIFNGFLLGRKGAAKSPLALFPLIKVGDVVIGADKLEHMFGMGQRYFKQFYLENQNLVSVLKKGIFKEKTFLGGNMLATGVFSYGDLAANFNGMRFWNHMLQRRDDVLGKQQNIGPYVFCTDGKWTRNPEKPIDFTNYVDESMQESTNCSKFATSSGLEKFKAGLEQMQKKSPDRYFSCPTSPDTLSRMAQKYEVPTPGDSKGTTLDHWIINRDGNEKVSYFNEF